MLKKILGGLILLIVLVIIISTITFQQTKTTDDNNQNVINDNNLDVTIDKEKEEMLNNLPKDTKLGNIRVNEE